jgi:hypothetical protein
MPDGVPFSEQERGRLERLAAAGDRIAAHMLRADLYFPDAVEDLAGRLRRPAPDNLVSLAERRAQQEPT